MYHDIAGSGVMSQQEREENLVLECSGNSADSC